MRRESALYVGHVRHRRRRPRPHTLCYRVFWLLLDLDELDALDRSLRLFSVGRANLFGFHPKDHGTGGSLKAEIRGHLAAAGLSDAAGQVRLLCMPRVLGYGFNPLSIYFCGRTPGEGPQAILYEVRNTFGERHSYLCPVSPGPGIIRQCAEKDFYVSPFLDMDLHYDFAVHAPDETIAVSVVARDAEGPVLEATLSGRRIPLSDMALLRVFFTHPLVTLKVIGGIHLEALRLLAKGLRLRPRPPAPTTPVSYPEARSP